MVRETGRFISMDAIAFPDYDMDGDTDMILIYTIEGGRVIDILDGYDLRNLSWQSGFEHNLDLANAIMQRTEEELNMTNVKKFLGYQGKGEKFSSWQEAYRFIARLENIQEPEYRYNLIYFDDTLSKYYSKTYKQYSCDAVTPLFKPFFYIESEDFIHLQYKTPKPSNIRPSNSFLRTHIDYAYFDNALWDLLQSADVRKLYKDALVEHYQQPHQT